MRLGLGLPQFGPFADPSAIATVAAEADSMGFDSLWAGERVHAPADPLTRYPAASGVMPEQLGVALDPLLTLTVAATSTTNARLGTSTLSAPLHPPLLLARSLAGIDRLSGGRLNVGLGLSWSRDEYDAVAVPWEERGARLDETIDILEAVWAPDPVEYRGQFWSISPGWFQPKPVQPKPPLYLGGLSAAALRRVGRRADGWLGVGLPLDLLRQVLDTLRGHAADSGRDPEAVSTILRINVELDAEPGPPHAPACGPIEHVCGYLHQIADLGVEEAFVDLQLTTQDTDELLAAAARFRSDFPG